MNKEKDQRGKVADGTRANLPKRGALIMKTVSLLLASSRRISNQTKHSGDKDVAAADREKLRRRKLRVKKMEEASGKLNPKLLETLKKKTHFSK